MATGSIVPFMPLATVTVAASTTTAQATGLPSTDSILVVNSTASVAFVAIGPGSATTGNTPIQAGGRQLFKGTLGGKASVILASGTGAVYFTAGDGTAY
jgi:hypothetical protein